MEAVQQQAVECRPADCRVMLLPSWTPLLSVKISYLFLIGEQFLLYYNSVGCPRWWSGKESTFQCRRHRRHGFSLWVEKIP